MSAKKLTIFLADDTLNFLSVLANDDEENIGISSAVNLAVQMCALAAREKLNITEGELLYCCDVLNGGAHLTEFMPPDHANLAQSLESMKYSLRDGIHEPGMLEKWDIDSTVVEKINAMTNAELFALAFATRLFWSTDGYGDYKKLGDCSDYKEWARQFVA